MAEEIREEEATPVPGAPVGREDNMTINLKMPDIQELKPRITVFGVGGAGGNAVNNMITAGLQGCDFVVANTDARHSGAEATHYGLRRRRRGRKRRQ